MNKTTEWEAKASDEQIKIRNSIEREAKEKHIPPSEIEWYRIKSGELNEKWAETK